MKIECLLSEKCSSEAALLQNVHKAVALSKSNAEVSVTRLSDAEATARGLKGSPTVLVSGREVEPLRDGLTGFS